MSEPSHNQADQRGARADGDIVGRDKIGTQHNHYGPSSKIERLLSKLRYQYENDDATQVTIDELMRYHTRRSPDGVEGLENKLAAANKSDSYFEAIEKKEMFSKLLERWSSFSSAQQIFVHILAKAETEFAQSVYPQISLTSESELNMIVIDRVVDPLVSECGDDLLGIDHNVVHGMIYWLAEQCFVRWHHPHTSTE